MLKIGFINPQAVDEMKPHGLEKISQNDTKHHTAINCTLMNSIE